MEPHPSKLPIETVTQSEQKQDLHNASCPEAQSQPLVNPVLAPSPERNGTGDTPQLNQPGHEEPNVPGSFWGTTRSGKRGLIQVVLKSVEFGESSPSPSPPPANPETFPVKRNRPSRSDTRPDDRQFECATRTMGIGPFGNPPVRLPTAISTTCREVSRFDRVPMVFSDPVRRSQIGAMNVYIAKFIACLGAVPILAQVEQPPTTLNEQPRAPWNYGFQNCAQSRAAYLSPSNQSPVHAKDASTAAAQENRVQEQIKRPQPGNHPVQRQAGPNTSPSVNPQSVLQTHKNSQQQGKPGDVPLCGSHRPVLC
eukprot:TRINITY_DN61576_c0_g1_i3.p1 TRINITY_DN61576_c0_g1~~TRINITY_DN61576_c0_g1_i3.p1  ORF type:complete len:310 (+),score=1.68 TRINITY_DN61576_c0_g1_i3:155-1084(+)